MNQYHKIKTVWKRDPDNNYKTVLVREWSKPEFEFLKYIRWTWTEKIDGTNIRVRYNCLDENDTSGLLRIPLEFRGKTDNAELQPMLKKRLPEIFPIENVRRVFGREYNVCLYGEGFGNKIQKAGKLYLPFDNDFILFDVRIGDWWLERKNVEEIAKQLGVRVVPIVGRGKLEAAIDLVRGGYPSYVSETPLIAEGLIMFPEIQLFNRKGERIITKIKHKDFKK